MLLALPQRHQLFCWSRDTFATVAHKNAHEGLLEADPRIEIYPAEEPITFLTGHKIQQLVHLIFAVTLRNVIVGI